MEFPGQLLLRRYQNILLQNSFYRKRKMKTIEVKYNEDAHKIISISFILPTIRFTLCIRKCRSNVGKTQGNFWYQAHLK